jgi:hypothetical protein
LTLWSAHTAEQEQEDDITLLALRFREAPGNAGDEALALNTSAV